MEPKTKKRKDDYYMITVGLIIIMVGVVVVALGANKK
jgi:glucose uptake protein GlcU